MNDIQEAARATGQQLLIDQEFQRNLVSTIAAIQLERYQKIRHMVEHASAHLGSEPPNYKQAWRSMSSAVEGLFGLMFPYVQLSIDEIERCLLPAVQGAYEGDPTAQRAARLMLNSFQRWVELSTSIGTNLEPQMPLSPRTPCGLSTGWVARAPQSATPRRRRRSYWPSAQRYSMAIFCPSKKPSVGQSLTEGRSEMRFRTGRPAAQKSDRRCRAAARAL